ncbi:hypothetical protein [Undibacterium flavidum]|uniref:Flagellar hook-length control protein FliK n=1 Tax=Undibacterium flavidum TaxID=2762297 RepID=A0ABR6YEX2_9BURK|nr:hypothetical protein [Undibacterium flavidum]MBC3875057.1 hypothetical protein [Undibacterium flavidum]
MSININQIFDLTPAKQKTDIDPDGGAIGSRRDAWRRAMEREQANSWLQHGLIARDHFVGSDAAQQNPTFRDELHRDNTAIKKMARLGLFIENSEAKKDLGFDQYGISHIEKEHHEDEQSGVAQDKPNLIVPHQIVARVDNLDTDQYGIRHIEKQSHEDEQSKVAQENLSLMVPSQHVIRVDKQFESKEEDQALSTKLEMNSPPIAAREQSSGVSTPVQTQIGLVKDDAPVAPLSFVDERVHQPAISSKTDRQPESEQLQKDPVQIKGKFKDDVIKLSTSNEAPDVKKELPPKLPPNQYGISHIENGYRESEQSRTTQNSPSSSSLNVSRQHVNQIESQKVTQVDQELESNDSVTVLSPKPEVNHPPVAVREQSPVGSAPAPAQTGLAQVESPVIPLSFGNEEVHQTAMSAKPDRQLENEQLQKGLVEVMAKLGIDAIREKASASLSPIETRFATRSMAQSSPTVLNMNDSSRKEVAPDFAFDQVDRLQRRTLEKGQSIERETLRFHTELSENGLKIWLGVDVQAQVDLAVLSHTLRLWLTQQGVHLYALVCNGRSILQRRETTSFEQGDANDKQDVSTSLVTEGRKVIMQSGVNVNSKRMGL